MNCPTCGHDTKVINTHKIESGYGISRTRLCRKCETKFSTTEYIRFGMIDKPIKKTC